MSTDHLWHTGQVCPQGCGLPGCCDSIPTTVIVTVRTGKAVTDTCSRLLCNSLGQPDMSQGLVVVMTGELNVIVTSVRKSLCAGFLLLL